MSVAVRPNQSLLSVSAGARVLIGEVQARTVGADANAMMSVAITIAARIAHWRWHEGQQAMG